MVDAMIGQEAVNIAKGFREAIPLTGLILTKMDGDARGGAAISIRSVTGVPIKFLGTGEDLDAIEAYDPCSAVLPHSGHGRYARADRKGRSAFDQEAAAKQAEKLMSGEFTLQDFADQLRQMRKMGPIAQILEMLPGGMGQMAQQISPQDAEKSAQDDRSDHQFDDTQRAPQSRYPERQPSAPDRTRLWNRSPRCQPPHQAVPRGTEIV